MLRASTRLDAGPCQIRPRIELARARESTGAFVDSLGVPVPSTKAAINQAALGVAISGDFATAAGKYAEGTPGRAWRSVEDTVNAPQLNRRRPLPYTSLTRSEDYYVEGALVWLEADQIIRQGTRGAKGLIQTVED